MSETPPNNPLLNTNNPQPGDGYLRPATTPITPPASQPLPSAQSPSSASTPKPATVWSKGQSKSAVLAAKKKQLDNGIAGIIDTVEAVVIALILALTFRAFVVEAFVIPTGSMAPTLLGAHFNVICPKCGYQFKESADLTVQEAVPPETKFNVIFPAGQHGELTNSYRIPATETRICPNCGFLITAGELPGNPQFVRKLPIDSRLLHDRKEFDSPHDFTFPWANNGDRILVLKYLYSIMEPQRWDVIVFKEPMAATDNYIKRLTGLPGETLEIVAGDLFVRPPSKPGEPEPPMTIARKPLHVQNAVWQNVYDNDYYPTDEGAFRDNQNPFTNPWQGEGASAQNWNIHGPEISYTAAAPGTLAFTPRDFYLYNVRGVNNDLFPAGISQHAPVDDVHLETVWRPDDTAAASVSLVAGAPNGNCFRVTWSAAGLKLDKWNNQTKAYDAVPDAAPSATTAPQPGQWHQLALNNVDRRVQFFIDGKLILQYDTPWTVEQAIAWANEQALLSPADQMPRIAINVAGKCSLGHLKLLRDVYYTDWMMGRRSAFLPSAMVHSPVTRAIPSNPLHLGPDEFFAMGDNSTASYDGRAWDHTDPSLADIPTGDHPGIVPRRFLLGKAFFVYWPAGFRPMNGAVGSLTAVDVPLVPNVGEMRFIR